MSFYAHKIITKDKSARDYGNWHLEVTHVASTLANYKKAVERHHADQPFRPGVWVMFGDDGAHSGGVIFTVHGDNSITWGWHESESEPAHVPNMTSWPPKG